MLLAGLFAGTFRVIAQTGAGALRLLLRTGQLGKVGQSSKTVSAFIAPAPALGSIGAASGFDNLGNVEALATLTDRSKALLETILP